MAPYHIHSDFLLPTSKQKRVGSCLLIAATCSAIALAMGYIAGSASTSKIHQQQTHLHQPSSRVDASVDGEAACPPPKMIPPVKTREQIGILLQSEGMEIGVELGVQHGHFAAEMLSRWPKCRRYYLVDIWAPQANYKDFANAPQQQQDEIMAEAKRNLEAHSSKTVWLRSLTREAVKQIPEPLDFVYVDARHDYCGAMEDIEAYWHLIRPGGIMAGHDFENAPDVMAATGQDWALCANGTIHQGAVQGAVLDFFEAQGLQVVVTYREAAWNSWLVRKPQACSSTSASASAAAAAAAVRAMPTAATTSNDVAPPQIAAQAALKAAAPNEPATQQQAREAAEAVQETQISASRLVHGGTQRQQQQMKQS